MYRDQRRSSSSRAATARGVADRCRGTSTRTEWTRVFSQVSRDDQDCAEGRRAHRDHGLRASGLRPRADPGAAGAHGRRRSTRTRTAFRRLRLRLRRAPGHRGRLRPGHPARGGHRGGRRLRRGQQRRQLQHHRRPGGPRDVRHRERRGPDLRPAPRRGLPAAGHPDRGHRALDRRPDAAPAAAVGRRAAVARPERRGAARRGAHLPRLGRAQDQQAAGGDRRPRRVPHPARRGDAARPRRRCCRRATWCT